MQAMSVAPHERCALGPRRTGHVREDKEKVPAVSANTEPDAHYASLDKSIMECPKWWGCGYELAPKQGISFQALLQTLHRPCGKQKVRQSRYVTEHRTEGRGPKSARSSPICIYFGSPSVLHRMDRMVRARIRHSIHRISPLQGDYVFSNRRSAGGDK